MFQVNGFVLAGGQSTRMGRDKALLELNGQPLAALAVEKLRGLGLPAKICGASSGSAPELARFAPVVLDRFSGCGPLAGIQAGLASGEAELGLFVPVDAPLIPVEFLRWLKERAETSGAVATIPAAGGRAQPLCAVYSRRLLAALRRALEAEHLKVMTAVQEAAAELHEAIDSFAVEPVAAALGWSASTAGVPVREWLRNVNTPEEFAWVNGTGGSRRN